MQNTFIPRITYYGKIKFSVTHHGQSIGDPLEDLRISPGTLSLFKGHFLGIIYRGANIQGKKGLLG